MGGGRGRRGGGGSTGKLGIKQMHAISTPLRWHAVYEREGGRKMCGLATREGWIYLHIHTQRSVEHGKLLKGRAWLRSSLYI